MAQKGGFTILKGNMSSQIFPASPLFQTDHGDLQRRFTGLHGFYHSALQRYEDIDLHNHLLRLQLQLLLQKLDVSEPLI